MEIKSEVRASGTSQSVSTASSDAPKRLPEGGTIKAEIKDVRSDQISIKLDNGQLVTGRLTGPIQAGVGDVKNFTVHYENGSLILEMKPSNEIQMAQAQKNAIVEMLLSSGFKASAENIKMALSLLDNQLPINKENLQKFNQSLKLMGMDINMNSSEVDKALFLMKNEMPINAKNVDILNNYISGENKLAGQLENLMKGIEELSPDLQKNVLKAMNAAMSETGNAEPLEKLARSILNELSGQKAVQTEGQAQGTAQAQAQATAAKGDSQAQQTQSAQPQAEQAAQAVQAQAQDELLKTAQNQQAPKAGEASGNAETVKATAEPQQAIQEQAQKILSDNPEFAKKLSELIKSGNLDKDSLVKLFNELPKQAIEKPEVLKELLKSLPEEERKQLEGLKLPNQLGESLEESDLLELVKSKLKFSPDKTTNKDIDKFLNDLNRGLNAAKKELMNYNEELSKAETSKTELSKTELTNMSKAGKLLEEMTNIRENLEFVSHMKNNVFVQLPIALQQQQANGELLVFRNKSSRKNKGGSASALIALDTVSMGRFEVYLQKQGKRIHCQFRLRDEEIEKLVKSNVDKLSNLLSENGYSLESCTYKKSEEAFTLLSKPEDIINTAPVVERGRVGFDYRT